MPRLVPPLVVVVLLLAACSGGGQDRAAGPSPTATPTSATPTTTTTGAPTPGSSPTQPTDRAPAVVALGSRFDPTATFRSPTGNIACAMRGYVICRATQHTWTSHAPFPQTECPAARRTSGVEIGEKGVEERSDCYDQVDDATAVLPYGHGLELQGVRCVSEERGVTCVVTKDGTGFSISRTRLSTTPWAGPLLRVAATGLGDHGTVVFPAGVDAFFHVGDYVADCLLDADRASCLVQSSASAPPGDPACDLDQALTATVDRTGPGRLTHECRSDANGGRDRLRTGESVRVGDLRCTAETATRLRCAHLAGARHGFVVDVRTFRGF